MKYQQLPYSCGPTSIVNALRCLGIKKTEANILKISNTNIKNGTSEKSMIEALTCLDLRVNKHEQGQYERAWEWLFDKIKDGNPIIISVHNWKHYVTVIGNIGDKIIIADPDASNKSENGILLLNKRQLRKLWYHTNEKLYTGLAIQK